MESHIVEQFPLTKKWKGLIRSLSYQNNLPVVDCIQEALIVEWEISAKILEDLHRENYFKKVLKRRIYGLKNDKWRTRKVDIFYDNIFGDDFDDSRFIDTIIQSRPFDIIYFEELLTHIAYILRELDEDAYNIFAIRLETGKRWKVIKNNNYKDYPHNRFYNKIQLIKKTVLKELKDRAHPRGSMALRTVRNRNATGCASIFGDGYESWRW